MTTLHRHLAMGIALLLLPLLAGADGCDDRVPLGADGDGGPAPDAAPVVDSGGAVDAGIPADDAGPSTCDPVPGDAEVVSDGCSMHLTILEGAGAPRLQIAGRVFDRRSAGYECARVDAIELMELGAGTLQTIDAGGLWGGDTDEPWIEVDAAPAVAARCGDTTGGGRVDVIGVVVRGRMDGGRFVKRCGRASLPIGAWGWPPEVIASCHSGIPRGTVGGFVSVDASGTTVSASLPAEGLEIVSVEPTVRFMVVAPPSGDPFDSATRPLAPVVSGGFAPTVFDDIRPGLPPHVAVQLDLLGADGVGPEGCPVMPPAAEPQPVLFAEITGTTGAGAFRSEVYAAGCARF